MQDTVTTVKPPKSKTVRAVYFTLGLICLAGFSLSWLPGIPTADLVVLALFFFARSSPRFEAWLRSKPFIQRTLARYEGGLTRGTKIQAITAIVLSVGFSTTFLVENANVRTIIGFVGLYGIWFVWSRPSKQASPAA